MVFSFEQNDFFAKRFVYARKTPNGNGSEAVSEPAAEKKKPTDTPGSSVVDESRQKISDLLDDRTKVDKLIGVQEGQVLSPKEMLANMKKVVREDQASDDWVRQTYDKFYAAELVGGVTKDVRRDIAKKEFERFQAYMDENTQKRINALVGPSSKPVYADALHAITHGSYTADGRTVNIGDVDKGTKSVISNLKLDTTDTVAYHLKAEELKKINEEIEAKKTQLIPFDQEIAEHDENKKKISKVRTFINEWLTPSLLIQKGVTYGLIALGGTAAIGFGAGLLGVGGLGAAFASGATVGSLSSGFSAASAMIGYNFTAAGGLISSLAATTGMTVPAMLAATGIGLGAYSFLTGSGADWIKSGLFDLKRKHILERKKENERKRIGLKKLEEDKKEAEKIIAKYQEDHKAKVTVLNSERKKYAGEQSRLNGLIEQATSRGDDTKSAELQTELEKVTAYLLNLDGLISVLKTTEKGSMAGVTHMDDISRNIQAMGLDDTTSKQLMDIATEKEKEWLGVQKELMDTRFRDGILKEKDKIEPELLTAVTEFLQDSEHKPMPINAFNKLRIDAPDLHRLIRTLQNLPKKSVLQKDIREILGSVLKKGVDDLKVKPGRELVEESFESLTPDKKRLLKRRPQEIVDFDDGHILPDPTAGANFQQWMETLNAAQLAHLARVLDLIGTHGGIVAGHLINKLSAEQERVLEIYNGIPDAHVQAYFREHAKSRLEAASKKLNRSTEFSHLPNPEDDLAGNIENITDADELKKIKEVLPLIRDQLYFNTETDELESVRDAEKTIASALNALRDDVSDGIKNNTRLVIDLSTRIKKTLPEPRNAEEENDLEVYGKSLIGTPSQKTFHDILKRMKDDHYRIVERRRIKRLETDLEKKQEDMIDLSQYMGRSLAAVTENPTYDLSPDKFIKMLDAVKNKSKNMPPFPSTGTLEERIRLIGDSRLLETFAELTQAAINKMNQHLPTIIGKINEKNLEQSELDELKEKKRELAAHSSTDPKIDAAIPLMEAEITRLQSEIDALIDKNDVLKLK